MSTVRPTDHEDHPTARIEAFSDGVFAIAITLLILDISVPHLRERIGGESLAAALWRLWPSYFAYIFSFIVVGIYWSNHHYIFKLYKRVDHNFVLLNVFFLMCISFLPFPTAVLAEYMLQPNTMKTAVAFYSFGLLMPALSWFMIWKYASGGLRLVDKRLDSAYIAIMNRQYIISAGLYAVSLLLSFVVPEVSLAISVVMTGLYLTAPRRAVYSEGN